MELLIQVAQNPDIHLAGETVNFNGNYFKRAKVDYNRTAMAIHIVYKLNNRRNELIVHIYRLHTKSILFVTFVLP